MPDQDLQRRAGLQLELHRGVQEVHLAVLPVPLLRENYSRQDKVLQVDGGQCAGSRRRSEGNAEAQVPTGREEEELATQQQRMIIIKMTTCS